MDTMIKKIEGVIEIGLKNTFYSKKFIGILIFTLFVNIMPSFVTYIIASRVTTGFERFNIIRFLATWENLLISQVFAMIIPIFLVNITLSDQIRLKRIFNLLVSPVKREIIFISLVLSITLTSFIIGLFLGLYLYLTINLGFSIVKNSMLIDSSIIFQMTLFLTVTSIFYGGLMMLITLLTEDYGLKPIVIFFFFTILYDTALTALGGSYIYITVNYYKVSLLANTIGDKLLKQYLELTIPAPTTTTFISLAIIICVASIFNYISLKKFKRLDFK